MIKLSAFDGIIGFPILSLIRFTIVTEVYFIAEDQLKVRIFLADFFHMIESFDVA